jgi:DUF438 domain-containing protein
MPSEIQQRLSEIEELVTNDRESVGKRTGVPFVLFTYDPGDELTVDDEVQNLIDKLEYNGHDVAEIDMRETVFSILEDRGILDNVIEMERDDPDRLLEGLKSSLLDDDEIGKLAQRIKEHAETAETVIVHRMGILYPFASGSTLMGQLEGNTPANTPIVFCYPATVEGETIQFLEKTEGTYYRAKVI